MKKIFIPTYLSFFTFILIVGVFHIWYFLEMMQILPRIPFKITSSMILLYIFLIYFIKDAEKNLNLVTTVMGIFIIYLIVYNLVHYYNYVILDPQTSSKILFENLGYIYSYAVYFFIGFYYRGYSLYKKTIYVLYTFMTLNALMFVDMSTYALDTTKANLDLFGIYLFLGDTYAIFAIMTIIMTKSRKLQLFLFLISLPILYILMSRTSLYIFILTMAVYMFITNKKLFFTYIMFIIGIVFLIFISNPVLVEELVNSRMLGYIFGDSDLSVDAREEFLVTGWNGIINHWFLGDFGGEAIYYNKTGTYIHSYLGLLRQYGMTAFILFGILIIFLLKELYLWVRFTKQYNIDYEIFIGIMLFTLVEIILARAIYFPYIFFSIGVVGSLYKNRVWTYR